MFTAADSKWMAHALRLAERGLYTTTPNPRVGCVLVKNGTIAGEGWHQYAGELHAEACALQTAGEAARGATVYLTLEPCSHHGRTPPCADALIQAGVARVVAAAQDPNPQVAGEGVQRLRAAGITVDVGLMESAAQELNIGFFSRMTRGTPWLRCKIAMSLDGGTALHNGTSKWITGEAARQDVQYWRARSCAVLTGIGTVLADNPQLNVRVFAREEDSLLPVKNGQERMPRVRQPLRVLLDSKLKLPLTARILYLSLSPSGKGVESEGSLLIYTATHNEQKISALENLGAQVVVLPNAEGRVDLSAALRDLAARGCNEILLEAGSKLNGAFLRAGVIDEFVLYIAPQLLGDMARGIAQLGELTTLDQRVELNWRDVRNVGKDLRVVARVTKDSNV
ncbi:MAG: bifunctional diaminohydroxyphosphoribosylaminopyrimidine deaminase/5-amino-6-(5-phosphoribosylamino)uracil reductase RibD [Candidatus Nitrotoga sp.]